jgi:hypothetical protein
MPVAEYSDKDTSDGVEISFTLRIPVVEPFGSIDDKWRFDKFGALLKIDKGEF